MIVRCPECSTGFKLPKDQVSDEGVKLRCSKCSHVFRFRIGDDGETEIFYSDSDRERNAENDSGASADVGAEDSEANEWAEAEATQIANPGEAVSVDDASEEEVDAEAGNKTTLGMPSASKAKAKAKKRSKSASSNYNPFPHANLDLKPKKESALSAPSSNAEDEQGDQEEQPAQSPAKQAPAKAEQDLDWNEEEATRVDHDPFGDAFDEDESGEDEGEDAFDGAFDDDDDDGDDAPAAAAPTSEPTAKKAPAAQKPPAGAKPAARAISTPASTKAPAAPKSPAQNSAAPASSTDAAATVAAAEAGAATAAARADKPANDGGASGFQTDNSYRPEDMVDPSFGQDGPSFDPDKGVVDAQKPAPQAKKAPAASPRSNARQAASAAQATNSGAAQTASTRSKPAGGWDVDPVDDMGPIEPHTVGGSGVQKVANFALIALLVGAGFFGLVAALSGWVLDFQRFPHMLEVAFEGAEFEPREEWTDDDAPVVTAAPEDPVRFKNVFATPVVLEGSDETVILVRGTAENVGETDFSDVVVRGMLYDQKHRPVSQTTAPLGGRIIQSQIVEAGSADAVGSLFPEDAAALSGGSTQPFSLIFTNVPKKVIDNPDVLYGVEVADSKSSGDQAAEAAPTN